MRRPMVAMLLAMVTLVVAPNGGSAGVSLTLAVMNKTSLLGEPVSAVMTLGNTSATPLKFSLDPGGDVLGPGSDVPAILVADNDGKAHYCLQQDRSMTADFAWKVEDGAVLTPPGKALTFHVSLDLLPPYATTAGQYELRASYVGRGKVLTQEQMAGQPPSYACEGCWKGKAESAPVIVTLQAPAGVDEEAYQAFKGNPLAHPAELLQRFPTSTYAGYVVYQSSGAEGMAKSDPAKVAEAVANGWALLGEIWVPSEAAKDKSGLAPLSGEAAVKWRQKWFGIVIKNHPDIWFADDLRLKLAVDQVALKNYQGGAADLEALSKQARPEVAEKAKAILDAMKQRGWVKE